MKLKAVASNTIKLSLKTAKAASLFFQICKCYLCTFIHRMYNYVFYAKLMSLGSGLILVAVRRNKTQLRKASNEMELFFIIQEYIK